MTKEKVAARKDTRDEKVDMYDVSSGVASPKSQESKKVIPQENIRAGAADMAKAVKEDVSADKGKAKLASLRAKQLESEQVTVPPYVASERKKEGYTLGAAMKESKVPEVQNMMPKITISLRVANINTAAGEVEKYLNKYEAKKMVKQIKESKTVITAELKTESIKDLITQLKTIGRLEEKGIPADIGEREIIVVIEIQGQ
jgi:hypothetical protein